jgi:phage terminase small subunit
VAEKEQEKLNPYGLTLKQMRWVEGYLLHGNGAKAARDAGYKPDNADQIASELLKKPRVRAAIRDAHRAASAGMEANAKEILRRLTALARSNIKHVARWGVRETFQGFDENDQPITTSKPFLEVKDSESLSELDTYAIESIKLGVVDGEPTILVKMRSPEQSLDKLMQIRKLVASESDGATDELKAALEELDQEENQNAKE